MVPITITTIQTKKALRAEINLLAAELAAARAENEILRAHFTSLADQIGVMDRSYV